MEKKTFVLTRESAARLSDAELSHVLFGGEHRLIGSSTDFARTEPERYKAAKQLAREGGRLALQSQRDRNIQEYGAKEPRRLSQEELQVRAQVSRAEVNRLYAEASQGSESNLLRMKRDEPERYAKIKAAHDSYATENSLVPKSNVEGRFVATGELAKHFNLPTDYVVTADELLALHALRIDMDTQARDAKSAADAVAAAQAAK